MGNTVSLSPLILIISNQQESAPEQGPELKMGSIQPIMVQFPFFLVEDPTNSVSGIMYKNQTQINNEIDHKFKMMYKCSLTGFKNIIIENMGAKIDGKIWKMVQDIQNMPIQVQDQIRIGQMELKLKYLIKQNSSVQKMKQVSHSNPQKQNIKSREQNILSGSKNKCRVCFESSQYQKDDPLISLCKCEGSVKYIHYRCLKQWMKNKIKQNQLPNCTIYEYSALTCQICKKELPDHFWCNGVFYSLVQSTPIQPPYAIFQSRHAANRQSRIILYRVKLNEGVTLSIGRSEQSAIPIKNTTVSRSHCLLYYTHKQLFLKDLKSKYGTFLYSRNAQYNFNTSLGLTIKIKKHKIKISAEKRLWCIQCCKGFQQMQLKVVQDFDQKVTMETSWDFLDFLE